MLINIIAVLMLLCVIFCICFAVKILREAKKTEKQNAETEARKNEAITEANKTKADARTGNHERDFNFMADKLHHLANK